MSITIFLMMLRLDVLHHNIVFLQCFCTTILPPIMFHFSIAQVAAPESDGIDGPGSDAGAAELATHGWQETEGGQIQTHNMSFVVVVHH